MAASKRPRWRFQPIKSGPYTATAARKPKVDDPSRPYVRLTYRPRGEDKKAARFADGSPAAGYYTRSEAQQVLAKLNREVPIPVAEAERDGLVVVRRIRDLIPAYVADLRAQGKSEERVRSYEYALCRIVDRGLGDWPVRRVGSKHHMLVLFNTLQEPWPEHRMRRVRENGCNAKTTWNSVNLLNMAASHGMDRGWFPSFATFPKSAFPFPSDDEDRVYNHYTPTEAEVRAVRKYLGEDTEVGQVVAIQAETGSRVGAVTKLRREHIDLHKMRLTLDDKGGWRSMEYPASLQPLLERLAAQIPGRHGRVFRTEGASLRTRVNATLTVATSDLGIRRWSSHGFRRHMSEVLLADRELGKKDYEEIMGHRFEMGMNAYAKGRRPPQRAALERASQRVSVAPAIAASTPAPASTADQTRKPPSKPGHNTRTQRAPKPPRHPIPIVVPVVIPTNAEALKMIKTGSR